MLQEYANTGILGQNDKEIADQIAQFRKIHPTRGSTTHDVERGNHRVED